MNVLSLFGGPRSTKSRVSRASRQRHSRISRQSLALECLEDRQLLSFAFTKVADMDTAVPGRPEKFTDLGASAIDGTDIAFMASSTANGTYVNGIYMSSNGGPLQTIVESNYLLPDGGYLGAISDPSLSHGTVAFAASEYSPHGFLSGIYTNQGGTVHAVVTTNILAPNGSGIFTDFDWRPTISGNNIVFVGDSQDFLGFKHQAVYLYDGQTVHAIADNTMSYAGGHMTPNGFGLPLVNNDGDVAFIGTTEISNSYPVYGQGVYLYSHGHLQTIADTSTQVPGQTNTFGNFHYLDFSAGVLTFQTIFTPDNSPYSIMRMFTTAGGSLQPVSGLDSAAYPYGWPALDQGNLVFTGQDSGSVRGMYVKQGDSPPVTVIQAGDLLGGKPVCGIYDRVYVSGTTIVFKANMGVNWNTATDAIYRADNPSLVNHPPVAADDAYPVNQNGTLTVSAAKGVLKNDKDPDKNHLSAKIVSLPVQGDLKLNDDGSFTYKPGDYSGSVTFTYQASDGMALSKVATVRLTVTAEDQTPMAGWTYDVVNDKGVVTSYGTGYHAAKTDVQQKIVAAANKAAGQLSGQSVVQSPWLTDVSGGDGARILDAINSYDQWSRAPKKGRVTLDQIKQEMYTKLYDGGKGYKDPLDQRRLAQQIIDVYKNNPHVPTNDGQAILDYLGIQKQCLEWVDTIAQTAHGTPRTYDDANNSTLLPSEYRPGMGVFCTVKGQQHAMIIVNICWDAKGNPTKFQVAEANYGGGWSNPGGMVPWNRKVHVGRTIPVAGYNDRAGNFHPVKVVSFES